MENYTCKNCGREFIADPPAIFLIFNKKNLTFFMSHGIITANRLVVM